jgi:hypothetical protein
MCYSCKLCEGLEWHFHRLLGFQGLIDDVPHGPCDVGLDLEACGTFACCSHSKRAGGFLQWFVYAGVMKEDLACQERRVETLWVSDERGW